MVCWSIVHAVHGPCTSHTRLSCAGGEAREPLRRVLCSLVDDGAMRTKITIAGIARYEGIELRLEWHVAGDSKCRALLRGHGGQSCTHYCDFCDATKDSGVRGKPRCNDERRVTWAPDLMGPLLAAANKVWPTICGLA
jgi:hypothetical protein